MTCMAIPFLQLSEQQLVRASKTSEYEGKVTGPTRVSRLVRVLDFTDWLRRLPVLSDLQRVMRDGKS